MNMQDRIAARRAELESQTRESNRLAAEFAEAQRAAAQAQRKQALNEVAAEVSKAGLEVNREGDKIVTSKFEGAPLDFDGLKRSAIDKLLNEEARKMWTPAQNWQVIAMIVAGFFLITLYGLGLALIVVGLLARNGLNKRYKGELRGRYPTVFPISEIEARAPAP